MVHYRSLFDDLGRKLRRDKRDLGAPGLLERSVRALDPRPSDPVPPREPVLRAAEGVE